MTARLPFTSRAPLEERLRAKGYLPPPGQPLDPWQEWAINEWLPRFQRQRRRRRTKYEVAAARKRGRK